MRIENLPLFPLNVVLFPGMQLPLHIFEQRYRDMISQCLADDPRFGVALIKSGFAEGGRAEVCDVGTVARIVRVGRYEDGRMDLLTIGVQRFRILKTDSSLPYLRGDVELLYDEREEPETLEAHAVDVLMRLREYLSKLESDDDVPSLPEDVESLSYFGGVLDLSLAEKQHMLESLSVAERLTWVAAFLTSEIELLRLLGPTRPVTARANVSLS